MAQTFDEQRPFDSEQHDVERIADRGKQVVHDARALTESVGALFGEIETVTRSMVSRHPMTALGVALGAGYIAGGGLRLPLARSALMVGGRLLLAKAGLVAFQNAEGIEMGAKEH